MSEYPKEFVDSMCTSLFLYQTTSNANRRSKYEASQISKWFCDNGMCLIKENVEKKNLKKQMKNENMLSSFSKCCCASLKGL